MKVSRQSAVSGKINVLDLPITADQVVEYSNGALIQDAFPQLTPAQREFIITGITEEEWNNTFKDIEEEA